MTGAGESYERVSKKEKYYLFSEAIRNRCAWCNGAGTVASLLIGTIISTLGEQLGIGILVTVGGYAKGATGAAMAISIGVALQCPPLVLFSLAAVGMAANELGVPEDLLRFWSLRFLQQNLENWFQKKQK